MKFIPISYCTHGRNGGNWHDGSHRGSGRNGHNGPHGRNRHNRPHGPYRAGRTGEYLFGEVYRIAPFHFIVDAQSAEGLTLL